MKNKPTLKAIRLLFNAQDQQAISGFTLDTTVSPARICVYWSPDSKPLWLTPSSVRGLLRAVKRFGPQALQHAAEKQSLQVPVPAPTGALAEAYTKYTHKRIQAILDNPTRSQVHENPVITDVVCATYATVAKASDMDQQRVAEVIGCSPTTASRLVNMQNRTGHSFRTSMMIQCIGALQSIPNVKYYINRILQEWI